MQSMVEGIQCPKAAYDAIVAMQLAVATFCLQVVSTGNEQASVVLYTSLYELLSTWNCLQAPRHQNE
jgi:hypothetical protein